MKHLQIIHLYIGHKVIQNMFLMWASLAQENLPCFLLQLWSRYQL